MEAYSIEECTYELRKEDANLEKIDLFSECIGNDGLRRLLEEVGEKNTSIKTINLNENEISDEGAIIVAEIAEKCEKLEDLYLGRNAISDRGCIRLAEMVEKSSTLKQLCLWDHPDITDEGAVRMAEAVERSRTLTWLSLEGCGISEIGAQRFIEALEVNTSLYDLFLEGNAGDIKGETLKQIWTLSKARRVHKCHLDLLSD
eukprot:TRINITY_DN10408_c1_g1_i1.p1 TRINITY_DN10408_c1_g1~~TRINITY_DN10408_c1_g1_i1.p1  ORF type:complete len:202 (+),score=38.33 TRINITY_DN10408_c1_g1_i1:144-749(+)